MFRAFIVLAMMAFLGMSPAFAAQDTAESAAKKFAELQKKAEDGDVAAQYSVGAAYFSGSPGVQKDYKQALDWLTRAAQEGHADAQFKLGSMYYNGYGVTEDRAETMKWYRKAADQGHVMAQANVAYLYRAGWGVEKDFVQAYFWYTNAMNGGDTYSAAERARISHAMTAAQVAEAEKLAAKWKPQRSKATKRILESGGILGVRTN
jgi:uncharacterized protein